MTGTGWETDAYLRQLATQNAAKLPSKIAIAAKSGMNGASGVNAPAHGSEGKKSQIRVAAQPATTRGIMHPPVKLGKELEAKSFGLSTLKVDKPTAQPRLNERAEMAHQLAVDIVQRSNIAMTYNLEVLSATGSVPEWQEFF